MKLGDWANKQGISYKTACARLYGKRSAKNKAAKAIEVIENES